MDRQQFLSRVREAVQQTESGIPSAIGEWRPLAVIAHDRSALVARFIAELTAVGGQAERVVANALDARVVEIARGWNARSCAMAGKLDEQLTGEVREGGSQILPQIANPPADPAGLLRGAIPGGTSRDRGARSLAGLEIVNDAARADFGLSDVVCAVAETGTLVLNSGARESRLATLLPPRYLAIVRAEQIVPNFVAAVELMKRQWGNAWPAAVTLVTGPSRTADIELSLTIGVHGPGQVAVLVVE